MFLLLAACTPNPTNRILAAPLPGEPRGLAMSPTGDLLVTVGGVEGCCTLQSLNRTTGTPRFEVAVGPGAPMVSNNRVFTYTPDGFAAHAPTGEPLWRTGVLGFVDDGASAAITAGGHVAFTTHDGLVGEVHVYTRLGERRWAATLPGLPRGPLLAGTDGTVYVSTDAGVSAVRDGFVQWTSPAGRALVVVPEGVIAGNEGTVLLDAEDGQEVWRSTAAPGEEGRATLDGTGTLWMNTPTEVLRLDPGDGAIRGGVPRICGPLTLGASGQLWGLCDGPSGVTVSAIETGVTEQSEPLGNVFPSSAPILDGGVVFALSDDGTTAFLNAFTGAELPGTSPWPRATADAFNTQRPL